MTILSKAAMALALFVTPSVASAADYLSYKFSVTGFEQRYSNDLSGADYKPITGDIVYNLPTYFAGASSAIYDTSDIYRKMYITGSASSGIFTLKETQTLFQRSGTRDITIKACFASGIPGPVITIDPSCSSVNFSDVVSLGVRGGDVRNIGGTVTGLTVTEGFGSAPLGLISYPVIPITAGLFLPEATTWAMMICGIGLVGGVMRRRVRAGEVQFNVAT